MLAFDTFEFWHWWIFAVVVLALEIVVPGFFFLWLSVAAAAMGVWILVFPSMGWEWQIFLFAAHTFVAIILWRKFAPSGAAFESDRPNLNQRGASYVGRKFTLEEPIKSGRGVLKIDDSRWRIACEKDLPPGSQVQIIGYDGTLLIVEPVSEPQDATSASPDTL